MLQVMLTKIMRNKNLQNTETDHYYLAESHTVHEDGDQGEVQPGEFKDVEEHVQEEMTPVMSGADVVVEERRVDVDERTVSALVESTCGCKKGVGSIACSSQYSTDHLMSVRAFCFELTRSELDMVVMRQLMVGMNNDTTTNTASGHRGKNRQRVTCSFNHCGKPICENMFRFLHTIGKT